MRLAVSATISESSWARVWSAVAISALCEKLPSAWASRWRTCQSSWLMWGSNSGTALSSPSSPSAPMAETEMRALSDWSAVASRSKAAESPISPRQATMLICTSHSDVLLYSVCRSPSAAVSFRAPRESAAAA